jgi:hypothetical protein
VKKYLRNFGLFVVVALMFPPGAFCGDHGFFSGLSLGNLGQGKSAGKFEPGRPYSFVQAVYVYETPLSSKELAFLIEPFSARPEQPTTGLDLGLNLGLKYYPLRQDTGGLYLTAGPGVAYTTIGLREQGNQFLFVVQGGVGYKYKNFFVEDKVRYFSKGTTATPDWSLSANVLSLGAKF